MSRNKEAEVTCYDPGITVSDCPNYIIHDLLPECRYDYSEGGHHIDDWLRTGVCVCVCVSVSLSVCLSVCVSMECCSVLSKPKTTHYVTLTVATRH